MQINVAGTLGDTYITCCKLTLIDEPLNIVHSTRCDYWFNSIKTIYSLLSNEVELTLTTDPIEADFSCLPKEGSMNYFPKWKAFDGYKTDSKYRVILSHSGKPPKDKLSGNTKMLEKSIIDKHINEINMPTVLLGTEPVYADHKNCLNLVGKTTLLEAMAITANASQFIGPEGLLSFVALSHCVSSLLYYTSFQAVEHRILLTPWVLYLTDLVKLSYR